LGSLLTGCPDSIENREIKEEIKIKKLIFSNEVAYSCHRSGMLPHDWIIGIDEQSLATSQTTGLA
jgi:hypothetical protein